MSDPEITMPVINVPVINVPVINVNGAPRPVPPGQTVSILLDALLLDRRKVAVERNEAIVPRSSYDATVLAPGDQIEIVHFIGGG